MAKEKTSKPNLRLVSFAWDLGYMIAIPIVVFAIGGVWLDKQLDTAPWFLFAGIGLAILITGLWIRSKIDDLIKKAGGE